MKTKLFILLALLPLTVQAQIRKVTEEQKQQAFRHVTEFCNLLTQWGNGQRALDTKIYALCSGNDCSAYDDVSTNKETTLRNYLLGIQKKYPKSYAIDIKDITLTGIFYQPELTGYTSWAESAMGSSVNYNLDIVSYKNAFIVYDVIQSTSNNTGSIKKKIIYDVKAGKITGFVTGSGTYISYIEGLRLTAEKSYKAAIEKFNYAASNGRASLKKDCYESSAFLSVLLEDWEAAQHYGELAGNNALALFYKGAASFQKQDLDTALDCFLKEEKLIENDTKLKGLLPNLWQVISTIYACPLTYNKNYNSSKAAYYLKKSANAGYVPSGYWIYQYCYMDWIHKEDISMSEAFEYLEWAGKNNYPAAYFTLGEYSEYIKNYDVAISWYEKSANAGNPFGMACLGRLLIQKGGNYKKSGCEWLRKSLNSNLEKFLNDANELENAPLWPESKDDVEKLLNENSSSSSTQAGITQPTTSGGNNSTSVLTPSVVAATTSSTNHDYSSPSYHYKKYRGPFNKAKDNYVGGISVGYVQKQWTFKYEDGNSEKSGFWEDTKQVGGIQAGVRINPQFGYGFGMDTGLYYEYYQSKSDPMNYTDGYGKYTGTLREHALYLPLRIEYRLNFSKYFQLFFYGGIGLDYGLANSIKWVDYDDDSYSETINNIYDSDDCPDWKRFNYSLEYGGGIRVSCLQFNFTMAKGLKNMSGTEGYKVYQGKNFMLALSIMF